MTKKIIIVCLTIAMIANVTFAVKIADVSILKGQRENRLMGLGIVVGLNGTGDGGKFYPAMKPLATFLQGFNDPIVSLDELKNVKNVALVTVEAVIGANGAREGDPIDVVVSANGSAKSLKGGRLMMTLMLGPNKLDRTIYAIASGPVTIDNDNPTTGFVKKGAIMEQDIFNQYIDRDSFTLVINDSHSGWSMASAIAMTINEAVSVQNTQVQIARASDPKNVQVQIPKTELADPANFISYIQSLPLLMPERPAKVTINGRAGTIIVDGNVKISPVTINFKSMTISTETILRKLHQDAGKKDQPFELPDAVDLKLLTDAMDTLQVPFEDRAAIIRELSRSGNLQGQLMEQP